MQIAPRTRFFAAIDENLDEVKHFLRTELEKVDLDSMVAEVVVACAEELFVNVNHYAYEKPGGALSIKIWSEAGAEHVLHLEFMDSGVPFNPLEDVGAPDLGPAGQRPIGGLGIFMVRQTMDEVTYRHESGCNIVHLTKTI